jgi:hypothetical protein
MEKHVVSPASIDSAAHEMFYQLIGQVPDSEMAWAERQGTLRNWRSDARFEPYWPSIDHLLRDDFTSFRRRVAAMQSVTPLEGYDYDAWHEQREYDRQHAHDHLP